MIDLQTLDTLAPEQLRAAVRTLASEVQFKQATIDKLTHENAVLKRLKFAAKSEAYSPEQKSLIEETLDTDLAAVAAEIEALTPSKPPEDKQVPKREKLPANLPRREIRHEPENTTCGCGHAMQRIGEDVAEKLDYQPGVFAVERHVRGKWVCTCCEKLVQAAVPAHIINKGLPTTGLLAQVLVAKYLDHLPLYRQEAIFERAGLAIARSTLAQWVGECGVQLQPLVDVLAAEMRKANVLHADETPVAMLKPGHGKTHRAYLWSYCTTQFNPVKAVVFDFAESRGGQHVRSFLGLKGHPQNPGWQGSLVTDDFSGYKACFELGVTEAGCMAHARRKFHELWANHGSQVGEQALKFFGQLYEVEREGCDAKTHQRKALRQQRSRPVADALRQWLTQQRQKVPDGSATARAIDYSLNRWAALVRFIDDGDLPIDNNWVENQIRPIAIGRNNWLFAGSLRAGKRAAAVMSLVHSARLNGHEPYAYLRDVLERLPTQPASRIAELLPHRWLRPGAAD
ncbi:MAG: IS66 family transposase [Burkholderiales bacterium]|nr:IS66 family transposase [Burkholderiales bacterium]